MKIGLVVCGAIVREMIAIANRQGWDYELTAVPAQHHSRPERIAPAVEKRLDDWADRFDLILIGYGDCGTMGALDEVIDCYSHVVRIPSPHCYEFFGGLAFERQSEAHLGTLYLTDFLAHHFDGLIWKGLGLDRYPELEEMYFGNYTHVMYLQQLSDHDESTKAQVAAAKLGLDYMYVDTGVEELEKRLVAIVEAFTFGN